ncbi:hypothetical protein Glove_169g51 [Diversispora epigaea]|uniref:Uncharacterized protein n=1 Tax=Diversispora epigaea TaxID=1348612 RepID=A0A397IVT4_9GLOM|nr:hypothetical protein Glove_169g51 [Diversispora epigaea]
MSTDMTCGNVTCNPNQICYLSSDGPSCELNRNKINKPWRLDNNLFPPIRYMGNKRGEVEGSSCDLLNCSGWDDLNKKWLIDYFYQNWINSSSSDLNTTIVPGSFVNPLEYLGSCLESDQYPIFFCSNGTCEKRKNSTNVCKSSNQCLSSKCGNVSITNMTHLEILTNPNYTLNCEDDTSIWSLMDSSGKEFYMDRNSYYFNKNSGNGNGNDGGSNSISSTLVVITIIFFILFVLSTLCCYAKKVMRKQREEFIQRSEGGLHRGGSLLSTINRSNSVRTLPPYTAVSDPPNQTGINPGIFSTLTNFLFPGELPPPYEDENYGSEDQDIRRITNLNFINDIQNADESRATVTTSERDDEGDREDHTTIEVRDGGEEETPVALSMNTPNDNNVNDSSNGNTGDDTTNDVKNEKNDNTFELKSIESIEEQNTDDEGEEEIGNSHERRESEVGLINK